MSLLFNILSRIVIAFLSRSKCLLISWLQSQSAVILEPKKRKSVSASSFSVCHEVMGPDAMIFPVVMYTCKSWTIEKAECQRTDVFELWCWRRLFRVPWTAKSSNQSILKEINPEYSLEGLMLKLKLQYFGHLMQRADSLQKKTLMLGKTEGKRETTENELFGWNHRLNRHESEQTPGDTEEQESLACCSPWGQKESDTT